VLVVDIFLIGIIAYYIFTKVLKKKQPGLKLRDFFGRFFVKLKKPGDTGTIESLYDYVIQSYMRRGAIPRDSGSGLRAREKILESLEGEELKVVKTIFQGYESKKYGGGVWNEEKTVGTLADQFRAL